MAQPPTWVNQYIGVPFLEYGRTPEGWDCWGCLRWGLDKHYGIKIPAYDGVTWHEPPPEWTDIEKRRYKVKQSRELYRYAATNMLPNWRKVDKPFPGCGVLMRPRLEPIHVGLVVAEGWMMHVEEECATVCIEYDGLYWHNRVVGFFEWAG